MALGISVGFSQSIGGNGSGATCTDGPCFLVTSDKTNATLGTLTAGTGNTLTWSGASSLVENGKTMTVVAKNVVVTYGNGTTDTLSMTGGNTFNGSFDFTNSTFVGNIISRQYNSNGSYNFSGNGEYTAGNTDGTKFALVGNIIGDGGGSNPQFNFTNDANMKGMISTKYTEGEGQISVSFNGTTGNTFVGTIGKSLGLGTAKVTFEKAATIKAESNDGYVMLAQPGNTSYTTNNLTLKAGGTITGGFIAGGDAGKGTNHLVLMTTGTTTINGKLVAEWNGVNRIEVKDAAVLNLTGNISSKLGSNQFVFTGSGTNTIEGNLAANWQGSSEISVQNGTLNLTGNLSASQGQSTVSFSGTGAGSIVGDISSNAGKTFIFNTGSGAIQIGDGSNAIKTTYEGGGKDAKTYITDYDSHSNGFDQSASGNTSGTLTLNIASLQFSNGSGNTGQTFLLDTYKGTASIDTLQYNYFGHTNIIRFRSVADDTSITFGTVDTATTLKTDGSEAKTFLQAKTIELNGNTVTQNGGKLYLYGAGNTTSDTITIHGSIINLGNNANTLTQIGSLGDKLTLNADAIYSIVNSNGEGQGTFKFKDNATANLNTGLLAIAKTNGGGGGSFKQSIILDNSSATANVLISAIDFSKSTLTLHGGIHQGSTLANNGSTIALGGNIAIYNNSQSSINTIDIKNGQHSSTQIIGDIVTERNGAQNNIRLIGSNGSTPFIIGNILTNGGDSNIILEDALFAPNTLSNNPFTYALDQAKTKILSSYAKQYGTGIVNTTQGRATIVSRLSSDLTGGRTSSFKINSQGGETNIVTLIAANSIHIQSYVNYSGGVVNMIFARSNDGESGVVTGGTQTRAAATEAFEGTTNSSTNTFFGLTYQDGVKLSLQDKTTSIGNNKNASLLATYGSLYKTSDGSYMHVDSRRDVFGRTDTVSISGFAVGTISQLDSSTTGVKTTYEVTLNENSVFAGSINLDPSKSDINLVMGSASKMILTDDLTKITNLTLSGTNTISKDQFALDTLAQTSNTVINLATGGASSSNVIESNEFRVLVIGNSASPKASTGLQGDGSLVFVNYVNTHADQSTAKIGGKSVGSSSTAYADRIVIENAGDNSAVLTGKYYMQLAVDSKSDLKSIKYTDGKGTADTANKNIAVATIAKTANAQAGSGTEQEIRNMGVITLQEADSLQGFDILSGTLKAVETDINGAVTSKNDYITYFVNNLDTIGADTAVQESTSTIAAASLDIYMANFNSLNKRMGELRDNANSQGAWGRIFGGQQTSDFGLGSTTGYVTVQAGYDYAFGFEGANNYLGFALAYGYSSSSTNSATNTLSGANEGIEGELKSNMVEVGIYNAYVQDEGWYNDSIFKFSYMMQDFTQSGTASGNSVSTNNFGIILSDEFGYRFKLGDAKEWYIDPQLEVAFGYVNGTEYTQISGLSTLDTKVDALMQLRARFGSSFGYDFKQFTQGKGVDAKLYLGMFYEYDYFNGGDLTLTTNLGGVNSIQSDLSSDGRVVVNVGTNVTVKENTRIYFDFETSFAGKIRTDYQANVGVRYSFGENTSYVPASTKIEKKDAAPLKVEEAKEQPQTTEQKAQ